MYKFRKSIGRNDFSNQYRKIIIRCKRTGYSMDVMRQTACLVVYPITVGSFAAFFNCTPAGRASDLMMASAWSFELNWLGFDASTVGLLLLSVSELILLLSTHLVSSQFWILIYMFAVELKSFTRTEQLVCLWTTEEPRARVAAAWNRFKPTPWPV